MAAKGKGKKANALTKRGKASKKQEASESEDNGEEEDMEEEEEGVVLYFRGGQMGQKISKNRNVAGTLILNDPQTLCTNPVSNHDNLMPAQEGPFAKTVVQQASVYDCRSQARASFA